jgi:hypothetical protein
MEQGEERVQLQQQQVWMEQGEEWVQLQQQLHVGEHGLRLHDAIQASGTLVERNRALGED